MLLAAAQWGAGKPSPGRRFQSGNQEVLLFASAFPSGCSGLECFPGDQNPDTIPAQTPFTSESKFLTRGRGHFDFDLVTVLATSAGARFQQCRRRTKVRIR